MSIHINRGDIVTFTFTWLVLFNWAFSKVENCLEMTKKGILDPQLEYKSSLSNVPEIRASGSICFDWRRFFGLGFGLRFDSLNWYAFLQVKHVLWSAFLSYYNIYAILLSVTLLLIWLFSYRVISLPFSESSATTVSSFIIRIEILRLCTE